MYTERKEPVQKFIQHIMSKEDVDLYLEKTHIRKRVLMGLIGVINTPKAATDLKLMQTLFEIPHSSTYVEFILS